MRAIFIAVGSEMLERDSIDTNSVYAQLKLMEKGILVDLKAVVRDDLEHLSWLVKQAVKRAQVVFLCGGLGPTEDDLTREAVATALKRELIFKEEIVEQIRARFKRRGVKMADTNTRQAFIIEGSEIMDNPLGTAPGLYVESADCPVVLLPGPPHEMKAMFDRVLEEKIAPMCNYQVYKRSLKFSGLGESFLDSQIADLYRKYKNPQTTILAKPGVIEVHLLGRSRKAMDEITTLTDELAQQIKEKLKDYFLTDKDISIEEYVLEELRQRKLTLATAESCTGGGLGNRITNIPGSSDVYLGGVVSYSNELKMKLLGVKQETLEKHGAVTKETAKQMAQGVRELTGADIGIGITGIAGPGGGTLGKPVGLVFMHLSAAETDMALYKVFPDSREMVKRRTINFTLNLIKEYLRTQ